MRKSTFFASCALLVGALFGFLAAPVQAAPNSPENIKALDQLIASSPDGINARQDDLILKVDRLKAFRAKLTGDRTVKSSFLRTTYWTGGRVPYVLDASLDAEQIGWFTDAAREWEKRANLKFFPRTGEANYVKVFWDGKSTGVAYSNLGMIGGEQMLMIGKGVSTFVTVHEIGHTLGLIHEQSRSDRDEFITVNFQNITAGQESQYAITSDSDNHRTYDFDSIMHYFDTAFSVDSVKKTMTCKPAYAQFQDKMGQQTHTSELDRAGMADIYGFPPGVTATPLPTPTLPPRPTLVCDDVTVREGDSGTTPMTFKIKLSYQPTSDVSFAYKIVRDHPAGVSDADLDKYSANPGEDYSVESLEGTITLPAATTDNNGNSTKEADITVSINGDLKLENDESLLLVMSDPIGARFVNDRQTIAVKGTISNDDFAATPTPVPSPTPPLPEPTPVATPAPTGTPRPTATPVPAPSVRVSLSPTNPGKTSLLTARIILSPSTGTTASIRWRIGDTLVARTGTTLDLARFKSLKRGDFVSIEVTPYRGKVAGKAVTVRVQVANTAPVAKEASGTTRSAVPLSIPLSGSDADGDALTFALSTRPRNGTATVSLIDGRWTLVYRSKVGFIGTESLSVIALDATSKSLAATVQIKVDANTSPKLASLSPSSGTVAPGATITFVQSVNDEEKNIASVALLMGNSARSAQARDGVSLVFDTATRTVRLTSDDGETLSEPARIGAVLENGRAKVVLRSVSTDSGALTLHWQVALKSGYTGQKTLWARVEDAGTLLDGFRSSGKITIAEKLGTPKGSSAGNS